MAERAAIDTIRGYFYQFDYSIYSLLNLHDDNHSITIEGIEDIDINSISEETAIQCKYYAKTEYNHSVIAKPIRLMLNHFKEVKEGTKSKVNYHLRGFYESGQDKLSSNIDVQFLKDNFLTYSRSKTTNNIKTTTTFLHHQILGLSDSELDEFLTLLKIDINAKKFEDQFSEIISCLKSYFTCTAFSAEYFFYNNALRVIKEYAIKPNINDRVITKRDFITQINTQRILFNEWFINIKGKQKHLANLRKEYFTFINIPYVQRFFLIEANSSSYQRSDLKDLITSISRKWSKLSKREPEPFCPYLFIQGISDQELVSLKQELISEGFYTIDGFDFQGADFNPKSILKKPDFNNKIKLKFLNSIEFIEPTLNLITRRKEIYQFYLNSAFFDYNNPSIKHTKIQVEQITDIKNII